MTYILPQHIYERIFSIAHNQILQVFRHPEKCCTLFAIIGASILSKFHNLKASPFSGVAGFDLGLSHKLLFAEQTQSGLVASENGFHSWIEIDGWFVDFTSPLFPEMLPFENMGVCPRRMFQKKLSESAGSIDELNSKTLFYRFPDSDFSSKRIDITFDDERSFDVIQECLNRYQRSDAVTAPAVNISGA